jgi:hypothetical protein
VFCVLASNLKQVA